MLKQINPQLTRHAFCYIFGDDTVTSEENFKNGRKFYAIQKLYINLWESICGQGDCSTAPTSVFTWCVSGQEELNWCIFETFQISACLFSLERRYDDYNDLKKKDRKKNFK